MAAGDLSDIDPNVLELLERRISERVAENVERTLKWRYGVVLAVFTAVAALFGWSVKSALDGQIQRVAAEAKAEADREIDRLAEKTTEAGKQADVSFAIAESLRQRVGKTLDDVDLRVGAFDTKLKVLEALGGRIDSVGQRLDDVDGQVDTTRARLDSMIGDRLNARVGPIDENLASLARQIADLQSRALARPDAGEAAAPADPAYAEARAEVAAIVEQSNQRVEQAAKPADAPVTVYFQFAGGDRQQAQLLSRALKAAGFQVPGEERTRGAASQHEVRYFHVADIAAAEELARAVNAAAAELGYAIPDVVLKDMRDYPRTKPRPGTVELWLEIPVLAKAG